MAMFDYGEVRNSIVQYGNIGAKVDSLAQEYKALQKKLNSDEYWTGIASDYYKKELGKLLQNLDDITVAFQNIPNYISRIEENHRKIDTL